MKVFVIRCKTLDDECCQTYWSSEDGWTDDIEYADSFGDEDQKEVTLPMDGEWVKVTRQWSVQKKDAIETMLIDKWGQIGMDIPNNFESIVTYCYEDVCGAADPENWHDGDVAIAFRRYIEDQSNNRY
jgi:hypothetical protein